MHRQMARILFFILFCVSCAQTNYDKSLSRTPQGFGDIPKPCAQGLAHLIYGQKQMDPNYWEGQLGRKIKDGEILNLKRMGKNTFVLRYDAKYDEILWEFYRITGRNYHQVSNFYPEHILDLAKMKGKRVLDVGTGAGSFVSDINRLSQKDRLGIDITGIDVKLLPHLKENPLFMEVDARYLPFEDKTFDHIFSTWSVISYEHQTKPSLIKDIMIDLKRVLKDDGTISLAPVNPEKLKEIIDQIPGLEIVESGWQRNIRFDWATILTIGRYVTIKKTI